MKIYLTGQNNFGNRGCEALVRSTVDMIRRKFPDAEFFVPSSDIARDSVQWPDAKSSGIRFVPVAPIPSRFIQWSRVCSRLSFLAGLAWPALRGNDETPPEFKATDLILSIGGDNYSLDYDLASLAYFVAVAQAGLHNNIPVILWGASVGPFSSLPAVETKMCQHLRRLTHITVRESQSALYLEGIGVSENVTLVADPAFALRPEAFKGVSFWPKAANTRLLGLNVSPLIDAVRRRSGVAGDLSLEVERFVRNAVRYQGFSVLLVPHVAPLDGRFGNNDDVFLAKIHARLTDLGHSVGLVPSGLNAVQLKHVIGQCQFFIGARTHSTVAALSAGVPTLSIAYSVKALGINHDLFGHTRYVVDTRLVDSDSLTDGLSLLLTEESEIRKLLETRIPEWRDRAALGIECITQVLSAKPEVM